jgi:ASC-1-like (ASCH) protein
MKTHQLKLATEPFAAIQNGSKIIESRLYDKKRRAIELGDAIIFINRENPTETLTARVAGLLRYPHFEALFSDNDPQKMGGPSVAWLLNQIGEFYPAADQQCHGVVGIRLELL